MSTLDDQQKFTQLEIQDVPDETDLLVDLNAHEDEEEEGYQKPYFDQKQTIVERAKEIQKKSTLIQHKDLKGKYRMCFLVLFSIIANIGTEQIGYAMTMFDDEFEILSVIYPSVDKDTLPLFESLGTAMAPLGIAIGSFCAGDVLAKGRRLTLFIANAIVAVGAAIMLIQYIECMIVGKLILSFGNGFFRVLGSLYVREVTPPEISGKLGTTAVISSSLGQFYGYILFFGIPDKDDATGNQFWRILNAFPWLLCIIQVAFFTFYYKYDTPKLMLLKNQEENVDKFLHQIYTSEERIELQKGELQKEIAQSKNKQELSWKELFTQQKKPIALSILLAIIFQLTGSNEIFFYSSLFLKVDHRTKQFSLLGVGAVNFLCCFIAFVLIEKTGRRTLAFIGAITMCIFWIGITFFYQYQIQPGQIAMLVLLVAFCKISLLQIYIVYLADILPAKGLGFIFSVSSIVMMIVAFCSPLIMEVIEGYLFIIYAVFSLVFGAVFIFLPETKGLTRLEIQMAFGVKVPQTVQRQITIIQKRTVLRVTKIGSKIGTKIGN